MARLIAVANQKGGAGKSTLTANLAVAWAARPLERRVLAIDLDPQANLSSMFGRRPEEAPAASDEVVLGAAKLGEAVVTDVAPGVDLIQASPGLAGLAQRLITEVRREGFLASALEGQVDDYDVVLVDCPPDLGQLTINAIFACREVVVPIAMTDRFACDGAVELIETLATFRTRGASADVTALVRNQVDERRNTYVTLNEDLEDLGAPLAQTEIPMRSAFQDAAVLERPLTLARPDHPGGVAYYKLAGELDRCGRELAEAA